MAKRKRFGIRENDKRNPAHLKFIRTLHCCKCGQFPTQACHIRTGTDGGMGIKPSDFWTIPMCPGCHHAQHAIGEQTFFGDIERTKALARELYAHTGNIEYGTFLVNLFYQGK